MRSMGWKRFLSDRVEDLAWYFRRLAWMNWLRALIFGEAVKT